jgi:ABC-type transport system involved in multi-copper enzyme maturation permease subunit
MDKDDRRIEQSVKDDLMRSTIDKILDGLHIVWAIARKDIWDALYNKLAVALLFTAGLMVFLPKLLPLIIDPPYTSVVVYDANESKLLQALEESDSFNVQQARSVEEVEGYIGDSGFGLGPEVGLVVPSDFDQVLEAGGELKLEGYINWANRNKAPKLQSGTEGQISELMGEPVAIELGDRYVYPDLTSSLTLGIMTTSSLSVVIIMGILLVPNLIFDEKRTKTIDALLVSPAKISQVVLGKVLAGWFYMLLTAAVVFLVNWTSVVHWDVAILFTFLSGLLSIAIGLILGTFFESQQEVTGWTSAIVVILLGAVLVGMMDLDIPSWIQNIIPWVPSVTLSDLFRASFSGSPSIANYWAKLSSVLGVSLLLYGVVIWKLRRSDR